MDIRRIRSDPFTMPAGYSMELFIKNAEECRHDNTPLWIKIFNNGSCISGTAYGNILRHLTVDHMSSELGIDISDYDILTDDEKFF